MNLYNKDWCLYVCLSYFLDVQMLSTPSVFTRIKPQGYLKIAYDQAEAVDYNSLPEILSLFTLVH